MTYVHGLTAQRKARSRQGLHSLTGGQSLLQKGHRVHWLVSGNGPETVTRNWNGTTPWEEEERVEWVHCWHSLCSPSPLGVGHDCLYEVGQYVLLKTPSNKSPSPALARGQLQTTTWQSHDSCLVSRDSHVPESGPASRWSPMPSSSLSPHWDSSSSPSCLPKNSVYLKGPMATH